VQHAAADEQGGKGAFQDGFDQDPTPLYSCYFAPIICLRHAMSDAKGRDGGVGAGFKPALPPGTPCLLLA
jgi:hypothetical protein